ncbi:THO complex subunit 3 [Sporothrix schenckii 1099-18]|uniref:Uncharacterized protein n=2 Tax=Sporothrix schenckii TaxID=29908 RepID=U7Q085_SPOS1|nr:THO complex subunit 3 [Sporothrix schenckii 1099-18]ERT01273.1 hypothetical protein HMPREF1624_02515 [Sporothrix schenckii ATCC 58251]KJR88436.1 THO complex subunit 3 [Sporothrix schenckii 1099-18]
MPSFVIKPRERLSKDKFPNYFSGFKVQAYQDPAASRGMQFHNPAADKDKDKDQDTDEATINGVRTIAWNPLSSLVATGSSDRTVRVWNPDKPVVRQSTELKGHTAAIEKVAFNPIKDAELCSLSADGAVKFWDVRTKTCTNEVRVPGEASTLVWAPDGDYLIVGGKEKGSSDSHKIFILERTLTAPTAVNTMPARTNDMAFCWSGKRVFVATGDGRTRILSFPELEPVLKVNHTVGEGESDEFSLKGHSAECLSVALSPTGRTLATGGTDAIIALWDTTKWTCQRTITTMAGPVRSLSFSWDGNYVIGGSTEGAELEVTQTESGEHVYTFKTAQPVPVVAWAPTRFFLAYAELGSLRIVGVDTERKY